MVKVGHGKGRVDKLSWWRLLPEPQFFALQTSLFHSPLNDSPMADHTQIKALDGTVKPVNGNPVFSQAANSTDLPSRPKPDGTLSSKDSIPPLGAALTGKQEHCKAPYFYLPNLVEEIEESSKLTYFRLEEGTSFAAGQVRDIGISIYHRFAKVWRPFQIRVWRSGSCRLRIPYPPLHFRPPRPKIPFPRSSTRKRVLAGQTPDGTLWEAGIVWA